MQTFNKDINISGNEVEIEMGVCKITKRNNRKMVKRVSLICIRGYNFRSVKFTNAHFVFQNLEKLEL